MGVEYFDTWFGIVKLIFGIDCTLDCFVLNEATIFFTHVDDPQNSSKIIEYVVKRLIGVDWGDGSDK